MEIYVLNKEIEIIGVFSVYDAIVWSPRLHEPGTFKATFVFTKRMNAILQPENILYKTDEEEAAIITRRYLKVNSRGEETIQVQGYMASRYLNRRIIWSTMVMSGTPEEIMRRMVYEQAIAPENPDRIMPRLRLGELKGYGGHIEKQVTYDNLQTALTDISKTSELGYRLRLDVAEKLFYFEVYRGTDRTLGSATPCIFSRTYGNVYELEYSEDNSNYRNVCLVGGTGEDEDRILKAVGSGSGIDRFEMFYNASGISGRDISAAEYLLQLAQKGEEKMAAYYAVKSFQNKINKNKAMRCEIGDYVTCVDDRWSVAVNTQIKGFDKGFSKTEQSFYATFGDDVPTLVELIKAKE